MKCIKRKTILFLFAIVSICLGVTAYAWGMSPPTGTVEERCEVIINIDAGNQFKNDLIAVFTDIASDRVHQLVMMADENYGRERFYSVIANTTYNVSVVVQSPDSEKYEVVNADGTEITSCHATTSGLSFDWIVREKVVSSNAQEEAGSPDTVHIGELSRADVLKRFNEKAGFIADDEAYSVFVGSMAGAVYKQSYLEVEGNTEEGWNRMSKYEQASYSLLFDLPKVCMFGENSFDYITDRNTFIRQLDGIKKRSLDIRDRGNEVYDAIVEVWDWHWKNWEISRTLINIFEEDADYGEQVQPTIASDPVASDDKDELFEGLSKDESAELESAIKEFNEDTAPSLSESAVHRKELADKDNYISIIMGSVISISILVVVGIAILVVRQKKRKVNLKD